MYWPIIEHVFGIVEDLTQAVDKVIASESSLDVAQLRRQMERLEFAWLRAVREAERSGEWRAEGFATTAAWLRARCNLAPAAASASVKLARALEDLPATAEAFAAGYISRAHAHVIAKAARPELAEVEAPLVDVARVATPVELRQVVARITDALDGDDGAARANAQYDAEYLFVSPTLDGMVKIDGQLSPERGELVLTALDAVMESNRTARNPRERCQQRADAFVELIEAGAAQHSMGPGRKTRPNMSFVVDLELLELRDASALVRDIRAEAEHVGTLSAATIRRLSCDACIARVITQGRSEPLDVGRSTRTIHPALWNALVVRDRGCVVPGCDRPPGWCEVHHKKHWSDGGETNLENCELRCWRHHRAVHEGGERPRAPDNPYEL